jgi:carbon-monoxide dehydrogenase large subunit
VNPLVAEGQITGAVAHGLGMALHEEIRYDPATGALLTGDLTQYRLPMASDVPNVLIEHECTPSTSIPGGFKGLGEGGIIPSPAAVGNAVAAAVPEIAGQIVETPLSALRVWTALDAAGVAR